MPKVISDKILPCGFRKPFDLKARLQHYMECQHEECRNRLQKLEGFKKSLKGGEYDVV